MAAGNFILYDEYKKNQFMTGLDLDGGSVKFMLTASTHSPSVGSNAVYGDISADEISHASYTTGGVALTTPAVSEISAPSGDWKFGSAAWELTFTGTDSPTLKYIHMYVDATVGGSVVKPLIGYFQLETGGAGTVTVLAGNKLQCNCPTNGWFRWYGART